MTTTGHRKPKSLHQDQTLLLQRGRANQQALEDRLQDLEREHKHMLEQYRELQLDYSHALARLWSLNNAATGR